MRWVALLGLVTGCETFFPLDVKGDGGTPDGPPPAEECRITPMTAFAEDFTGTTLGPVWVNINATAPAVVNDRLELTLDATNGSAGIQATPFFDLRESSLSITADASVPLVAGSKVMLDLVSPDFALGTGSGHFLRLVLDGDTSPPRLHAQHHEGGTDFELASEPYDPMLHGTWTIARIGDDIVWSAGDVQIHRTPLTWSPDVLRPRLVATNSNQQFVARYDELNSGVSQPAVCPADGLNDDFSDLDPDLWIPITPAPCAFEIDAGETLQITNSGTVSCRLSTTSIYNLVDHAFTVQLVDTTGAPSMECFTIVEALMIDRSRARFVIEDGQLRALTFDPMGTRAPRGEVEYMPTEHQYLRLQGSIEADKQKLEFRTSPDGANFDNLVAKIDFPGLDRVQFELALQTPNSAQCVVRMDNVNPR
jgi:hypothetical protein